MEWINVYSAMIQANAVHAKELVSLEAFHVPCATARENVLIAEDHPLELVHDNNHLLLGNQEAVLVSASQADSDHNLEVVLVSANQTDSDHNLEVELVRINREKTHSRKHNRLSVRE